jgi:hypothetical protein
MSVFRSVTSVFVVVVAAGTVWAQVHPRLAVLTPPGGQAGTSVKVTLTGTDLDDVASLLIAPAGLTAQRIPDPAKKDQFLANQFEIKIPAETPPGTYDVRAVGSWGISNPRAFVVGELPELQEKEPNNDVGQAQSLPLGSTVNGVISAPADVDYYSVMCKQGDQVVVSVASDSIDSRLESDLRVYSSTGRLQASNRPRAEPDAVCSFVAPTSGTFYIRLCAHAHIQGNAECFYRLSVSTRPWIDSLYPPVAELGKASTATAIGRNLPGATQATQASPLMHVPLQKQQVTLAPPTDPLVDQQLTRFEWQTPPRAGLDGFFFRLKNSSGWSNAVPVTYAHGTIVLEHGDNDAPEKAQDVSLPCEIIGRIERPNDRDWYAFTGKAGEVIAIEGFADRLGVPIDLYFEVHRVEPPAPAGNKGGKQGVALLGEFDDHPDQPTFHRFYSRTDDPATRFTVPSDGKYVLMVSSRDATLRGDPRLVYRISLHHPRPDFRAVLVDSLPQNPSTLCLHPSGRQCWDVILYRRDGFMGPVTLSAEGLPPGVTCAHQQIATGADVGTLVLSAADKLADFSGTITVRATAVIDGQQVMREVRAGCLVWPNANEQNRAPGISRLCRTHVLAVRQTQAPYRLSIATEKPELPAGGRVPIKIKVERFWPDAKQPIILTALNLPRGVSFNNNQPLTIPGDKNEMEAQLQTQNNLVAETFSLVLQGNSAIPFNKDPKAKQKPNTPMVETSLPVVTTIYRKVVDVSFAPESFHVKQGGEQTVTLKLNRLHGYQGPFQVQIQGLPNGISVGNVNVPEKANEAKLVFKAAKNAAETKAAPISVRVSGTVAPINLTTEGKVTVAVNKKIVYAPF